MDCLENEAQPVPRERHFQADEDGNKCEVDARIEFRLCENRRMRVEDSRDGVVKIK